MAEETLRTNIRAGLDLLDSDPPADPERWKTWLWDTHLAVRAHVAELRAVEEKPITEKTAGVVIDVGF
jgi:hypothetical protein